MMKRHTTQLLTAPAGTGKSYMVTRDLVDEFLPSGSGVVFCNMPYGLVPESHSSPPEYLGETFAERIGAYVARKYGGDAEDIAARIEIIPDDVLKSWMRDGGDDYSGPWEYFEGVELSNALIIIDEAHNFCGRTHGKDKKRRWMEFCGELRHRGHSCIQFVTQSPNKLAKEIIDEAGKRQALVDAEEERDPWFGIQMFYWYELRAKIFGTYRSCFVRLDLRDVDGKKTQSHVKRVPRLQEIFALYDSFNATAGGDAGSAGEQKREYEKRGWLSFLWWFCSRNASSFFKPIIVVSLIYLSLFHGRQAFGVFTKYVGSAVAPKSVAQDKPGIAESVPVVGVARVEEEVAEEVTPLWVLRVVTPDTATFNDGVVLSLGSDVVGGDFDGYVVEDIDFAARSVALFDGVSSVRFLLGRVYKPETGSKAATSAVASPGGSETKGQAK